MFRMRPTPLCPRLLAPLGRFGTLRLREIAAVVRFPPCLALLLVHLS
jgi:hypothetical protein